MNFVVACKNQPGSFWVDKKSFDQITANAQHHLLQNVKVGMKLTAATVVAKPSTETPLGTPSLYDVDDNKGIVAAEPDFHPVESGVMNRGKETPLGSPTIDFSKDN